jgi:hypothetical protein
LPRSFFKYFPSSVGADTGETHYFSLAVIPIIPVVLVVDGSSAFGPSKLTGRSSFLVSVIPAFWSFDATWSLQLFWSSQSFQLSVRSSHSDHSRPKQYN